MRSESHHQLSSLQVKSLSILTIEGTSPTMLVSRSKRPSISSTIDEMWKKNNNNRFSSSKWRRNHIKKRCPIMTTTSPRRQRVSLLTTPSKTLSTNGFSRTRSTMSPRKSGSREHRMSSSICWIQDTENKLTSILKRMK